MPMNKQEFIDRLRSALNGRVTPALVTENVNYYEDYINMEIRKGKSEEEVLQLLGDPRLIARTIIDTNGGDEQAGSRNSAYENRNYQGSDPYNAHYTSAGYQSSGYQNTNRNANPGTDPKVRGYQMPGWLWGIIVLLIIVVVFSLIFSVVSFLAPILIPVMVVMFLVKLFRDWLN